MADECETPEYAEGPCHCAFHDPERAEEAAYELARVARIKALYRDLWPLDMATRIVDLEDELGSDVDGICTGMHADVAEAHAEIERLTSLVESFNGWRASIYEVARRAFRGARRAERSAQRYRLAWLSARRRAHGARDLVRILLEVLDLREEELTRYRLAWLSARRRAREEIALAREAVELLQEENAQLRTRLGSLR